MASAVIDLSLESSDSSDDDYVPANSRQQRKRAAAATTDDDDRKMPGSPASRTSHLSRQWSDGRRKARRRGDRRPTASAAASASSAPDGEDGASSPDRKMTSAEARALGARERRENRSRGNDSNSNGSGTSPGGSDSDDDPFVVPPRSAGTRPPRRARRAGNINLGESPVESEGGFISFSRYTRGNARPVRRLTEGSGTAVRDANSLQDGTESGRSARSAGRSDRQIAEEIFGDALRSARARSARRSASLTVAARGDAMSSRSSSAGRRTSRRLAALAATGSSTSTEGAGRPSYFRGNSEAATGASSAAARSVTLDSDDDDFPSFSAIRRRAAERRRNDPANRADIDRRRQRWTEAVLSGRESAASASASSASAAYASAGSSASASMSAATAGYNFRPSAAPAAAAAASSSTSTEWECSRYVSTLCFRPLKAHAKFNHRVLIYLSGALCSTP